MAVSRTQKMKRLLVPQSIIIIPQNQNSNPHKHIAIHPRLDSHHLRPQLR